MLTLCVDFEWVLLQSKHIDLLVEGVQSPNAKLESLSFYHVYLGYEDNALLLLLGRCSQLKRFSLKEDWLAKYARRMDDRKLFKVPNIGYRMLSDGIPYDTYMLTTLDLFMRHKCSLIEETMLPDLIKRSPHLRRLRISFIDIIPHGEIMRAAVDHCHSLKDLLVMDDGGMMLFGKDR